MTTDSNNTSNSSQPTDRYSERAQRRAERRAARGNNSGAWLAGVALIAFGVIIMLQNMGALQLHNWWAVFILLPALGSFAAAYGAYRANGGRLNTTARGSIIGGLIFTAIAAFFLFDLNSSLFWPVLFILAGIGLLVNTLLPD